MSSDPVGREVAASSEIIPGDRLYDWGAYSGVPGGIPNRTTIFTTLSPGASASQVNAAIASCPSGQVVQLAAGTYSLGEISFGNENGVTLRGAGAGKTIIYPTSSRSFSNSSSSFTEASGIAISSGYEQGSTRITLASSPSSYFFAGNLLVITEEDSPNKWGTGIGVYHRTGKSAGIYGLSETRFYYYMSRIVAVNGNVITLATPLPVSYSAALQPKAYVPQTRTSPTSMCGVEDLTIDGRNSVEGKFFINTADRFWVKGVEIKNCTGADIGYIEYIKSFQCEIRRCYIHDATGYPHQTDGQGTSFNYGTCNSMIADSIFDNVASIVQNNGASANAYIYNYAHDTCRDSDYTRGVSINHGPHGLMNLIEGNIMSNVTNDGYHGSGSHTVIFRNNINGLNSDVAVQRKLVNLCRGSYYYSAVGNIIGDPSWTPVYYDQTYPVSDTSAIFALGWPTADSTSFTSYTSVPWDNWSKPTNQPDADVVATLVRHGNYDYYHNDVVWDSAISSRAIPDSLCYSSKPSFFGTLQWPPIGPDVSGRVTSNPAKARWDAYQSSGNLDDLFRNR